MAERRKNRKRKEQLDVAARDGKPSKDEYAVAKFLRQKLPEKKTSLLGHKVDYFIASKAIDCLLDSPWATKSDNHDLLFSTRESVVYFMDRMLQHKFFHRARKILIQKETKKKKKDEDTEPGKESEEKKEKAKEKDKTKDPEKEKEKKKDDKLKKEPEEQKDAKEKETKKDGKEKETKKEGKEKETKKKGKAKDNMGDKTSEKTEDKKDNEGSDKKKERKKLKLDMHWEQLFLDGSEVYVWIYDPIPMRTWVIGMLMVAGAVLVCLFPLWPQVIRHYIYYLSVAAALFLVVIIGLAIIRLVVFVIVWALTLGKHHLWLLPNLTADVGFLESFWPLYEYEYKGGKKERVCSKEKEEKSNEETTKEKETEEKSEDSSLDPDKKEDDTESEHDSEEDKVKTENGFEMVETNEAEEEALLKQSTKK